MTHNSAQGKTAAGESTAVKELDLYVINMCRYGVIYCKREKICWAKLLQIPFNEVFHGKTFTVPYI